MPPASRQRKRKNSARVNLILSVGFHALALLAVTFLAAREGLLGETFKEFAVTIVAKDKEADKTEEEAKLLEELKPETGEDPANEPPPPSAPPDTVAASAPPPARTAPPAAVAAPKAAIRSSFHFSDGAKAAQGQGDPVSIYRSLVEYSLQTTWVRPADVQDPGLATEVEVSVDSSGRVTVQQWKTLSSNEAWNASVRRAFEVLQPMRRPPPPGFPATFRVRFDVVPMETADSAPQLQ